MHRSWSQLLARLRCSRALYALMSLQQCKKVQIADVGPDNIAQHGMLRSKIWMAALGMLQGEPTRPYSLWNELSCGKQPACAALHSQIPDNEVFVAKVSANLKAWSCSSAD